MIKLNPDNEIVELVKACLENSGGYCPCSLDKTDDTKCICRNFREMKKGTCHCGLYIKE